METNKDPEAGEAAKNPLRGLGQKLQLHVIIPIIYAIVLMTVFIITQV
jgi:hypothetical protein